MPEHCHQNDMVKKKASKQERKGWITGGKQRGRRGRGRQERKKESLNHFFVFFFFILKKFTYIGG